MLNKINVIVSAAIILGTSSAAFAMTDAKYTSHVDPQSLNLGYGQASSTSWNSSNTPAYMRNETRMSTTMAPSAGKVSIDQQYLGFGVPRS